MNLLDIQSWWEIPSIAHFCSLFQSSFDLPQFDIDELEFAILNDATEGSEATCIATAQPNLLTDLAFRLVTGSKSKSQRNRITSDNYQLVLNELLRNHCEQFKTSNPFSEETSLNELDSHNKVRVLQLLCDIRLDAEDVPSIFATLEAESLRVDPIGKDAKGATYWYFYGTRLYRDNAPLKVRKSLAPENKKSPTFSTICKWQLVCQTPEDWNQLAASFEHSTHREEIALHNTLTEDFLPNIRSMFVQQEQLKRRKLIQANLYANIRRSNRVVKPSLKHEKQSVSRAGTTSPFSDLGESVIPRSQQSENKDPDSENGECESESELKSDGTRRYPARRHRRPRKRFTF